MINKILAIQGNHPSTLNPKNDTSIFLQMKFKRKNIKYFIMIPKIYQSINSKVIASGFFIKFNYKKKIF